MRAKTDLPHQDGVPLSGMNPDAAKSGFLHQILTLSNSDKWAIAITVIFLAVNLASIDQYGMSWDEPPVMDRGRDTMAFLTGSAADIAFADTTLHRHPAFYATFNYLLTELMIRSFEWKPIPAGHLLNILTASVGIFLTYLCGRQMFNPTVGLAAMLFLVAFPRFVAHAHVNAKDIPVMVFSTLTVLLLHNAANRGSLKGWALAGVSFAGAVTTKLDGLFVIPIFFIPWMLGRLGADSRNRWKTFQMCYVFAAVSAFCIVLFWPALWHDPLHLFSSVRHFSGNFSSQETYYLGEKFRQEDVPWHYLHVHLVAVTPLVALSAFLAGAAVSNRALWQGKNWFEHSLLWCWLLVPLLARSIPGTLQYDGMRHVFIVLPAIALLAGVGVNWLRQNWPHGKKYRLVKWTGSVLALLWLGWQGFQIHPFGIYYLNEGVRAGVPSQNLSRTFDFYGWGTIFENGVEWVNANAQSNASVAPAHNDWLLQRSHFRSDLRVLKSKDATNADLIILGGWRGSMIENFNASPVFTIRRYENELLLVLSNRPPDHTSRVAHESLLPANARRDSIESGGRTRN